MAKVKSNSLISDPKFKKWIRDFDFNDPKFLAEVDKRNRASKTWVDGLKRKAKRLEAEMNWSLRIGGRERG